MKNILIVGVGSVGTLIGASLVKAGLKITFAGKSKSQRLSMVKKQGLKVAYHDGQSFRLSPLSDLVCFTDTETYSSHKFHLIFQTYGLEARDLPTESQVYSYIQEPGSQNHLSSLAQDFLQHRQGEISLITALVEMAEVANIQAPTLSSLAELLELGQQYTTNTAERSGEASLFNLGKRITDREKCYILTFDRSTGYCVLNENAFSLHFLGKLHIPDLLNHLVKINVAALS